MSNMDLRQIQKDFFEEEKEAAINSSTLTNDKIKSMNQEAVSKGEVQPFVINSPKEHVAFPSALIRSQLFASITRETYAKKYGIPLDKIDKLFLNDEMIASWKGVEIKYSGALMNQTDLDVFLVLLDSFREVGTGYIGSITLRDISKKLGRGNRTDQVSDSIKRLTSATVEIKKFGLNDKLEGVYTGHLIEETLRDNNSKYYVKINPRFSDLFSVSGYVMQELPRRLSLGKNQTAKWLYGYVLSHESTFKEPHRVYFSTLQKLSGSTIEPRVFKQRVKKIFDRFVEMEVIVGYMNSEKEDGIIFWKKER